MRISENVLTATFYRTCARTATDVADAPHAYALVLRLFPRYARMRMSGALQTHVCHCSDGFERKRHSAAINGVGFVDQLGQKLGSASRELQPLGGVVQQVVRRRVGIDYAGALLFSVAIVSLLVILTEMEGSGFWVLTGLTLCFS